MMKTRHSRAGGNPAPDALGPRLRGDDGAVVVAPRLRADDGAAGHCVHGDDGHVRI